MNEDLVSGNSVGEQAKWKYLKFEIRKFAQNNRKIKNDLENKLKDLENDLIITINSKKLTKLDPNLKKYMKSL